MGGRRRASSSASPGRTVRPARRTRRAVSRRTFGSSARERSMVGPTLARIRRRTSPTAGIRGSSARISWSWASWARRPESSAPTSPRLRRLASRSTTISNARRRSSSWGSGAERAISGAPQLSPGKNEWTPPASATPPARRSRAATSRARLRSWSSAIGEKASSAARPSRTSGTIALGRRDARSAASHRAVAKAQTVARARDSDTEWRARVIARRPPAFRACGPGRSVPASRVLRRASARSAPRPPAPEPKDGRGQDRPGPAC